MTNVHYLHGLNIDKIDSEKLDIARRIGQVEIKNVDKSMTPVQKQAD